MSSSQDPMHEFGECFEPLPPAPLVPVYPGMLSSFNKLLKLVSCVVDPLDEDWLVISPDGRQLKVPKVESSGNPVCSPGVAMAMAELRVTMGGGPIAFAIQEGTERLWHRSVVNGRTVFHPIASVEAEFGIAASEHMSGIDDFIRHAVSRIPQARLVLGVKFKDKGFARTYSTSGISHTTVVEPDDPRFSMIWALSFPTIDYCEDRADRFLRVAQTVVDGAAAAEMLARIIAAPVCQPYMHGMGFLTGPGGNGKGRTIKSISALYGRLAAPFNLAALLGMARSSSTTNDQAALGLLTGLLAYDSDAVNPGQGMVENIKKATAGESLSIRLLQQNVSTNTVMAFMIAATNRSSTLPSTPEWRRRIWTVPFRSDTTEETVLHWSMYLGDGMNPDDGIIDALMAGAASFAEGRPDPETINRLTEGLTLYGKTVRDLLMSCAPLENDGFPVKPRVPVSHPELKELHVSEKERSDQLSLMGLSTSSMRDVHGDGRTRQVIFIKDMKRFVPFADEWRRQNAANMAEQDDEDERKRELVQKTHAQMLNARPLQAVDARQQLNLLQTVTGLDGWVITPSPSQWNGKGIIGDWKSDESKIRHPLHDIQALKIPDRYGLSLTSNLLIIDCDAPKQGGEHGIDSLMRIPGVTLDDLDTVVMRSPNGLHLIYQTPNQWIGHVKASTGVNNTRIDLRPGVKSYVVGPGSHWTDKQGEHVYLGIIRLPSPRMISNEDGTSQEERRIPLLPEAIAQWLEPAALEVPSPSMNHSSEPLTTGEQPWRVKQPFDPGATHGAIVSQAVAIVHAYREKHHSSKWLEDALRALQDEVLRQHPDHVKREPGDVYKAIKWACRNEGIPVPSTVRTDI